MTHRMRIAQLRADYERAGQHFDLDEITRCATAGGTADFTGSEVERLRNDLDRQDYETKLQRDTLAKSEGR
jgi:hypothetical protein